VKFDACFRDKICGWQPAPPVPPVWRTVAVGLGGHACALKLNGELYCWGLGEQGQLGYVAPKECTVGGAAGNLWGCSGMPGLVVCTGAPCNFIEVTAGLRHTCALDANQDAWCWGENYDGQLGLNHFDPTTKGSPEPRRVVGGLKFKSIRAGFSMTCGLTITHQVYCWGKNSLAVIPALTDRWANDPRLVPTPEPISEIDLSWSHVCGQVTNGHLYCWGSNWKAELGSLSFPTAPTCATCPGMPLLMQANIPALANQQVSLMSVGSNGSCAHLASGGTPCWGTTLPAFPGGRSLDRLSRGVHHYCAISRGTMECAGTAALGDGSQTHPLPGVGPVSVSPAKNFRELDTGSEATCAIATDENVYCWGSTTFAQLGLGQPNGYVTRPTALAFPSTLKIPPKHGWQP
jgi:alpha-tubulin suppressor-like RCC1 family protein